MAYSTTYHHLELGDLVIASDGSAVTGAWFVGQKYFGANVDEPLEQADDQPILLQAREWLDRYFTGDPLPIAALPLAARGTAFQRAVWDELARIPFGEVRTYTEVAASLGCKSARAVGTANGRNPVSVILPCHRLVGSGGSLAGYAGGLWRKQWLLQHEGVDVSQFIVPKRRTAL